MILFRFIEDQSSKLMFETHHSVILHLCCCLSCLSNILCYSRMPLVIEFFRYLHVAEIRTGIRHYRKVVQLSRCFFHVTVLKHSVIFAS